MRNEFDDSSGEELNREFWGSDQSWPRDTTPRMGTTRNPGGADGQQRSAETGMTGAIRAVKDSWAAFRPPADRRADRSGALPRTRQHGTTDPNRPLTPPNGAQRPQPGPTRRKRVATNELSISDLGAGRSASLSLDAWDAIDDWSELDDLTARHEALRASRQHRDHVRAGDAEPHASAAVPSHDPQPRPTAMAAFHQPGQHGDAADGADDAFQVPVSTQIAERFGWRGADPLLVKALGAALLTIALLPLIWSRGGSDTAPQASESIAVPTVSAPVANTATPEADSATSATSPSQQASTAGGTASQADPAAADSGSVAGGDASNGTPSADKPADAGSGANTVAEPKTATESDSNDSGDADGGESTDDGDSGESTDSGDSDGTTDGDGDAGTKATTTTEATKKAEPKCSLTYEAVDGDSWWGIAERADTSLDKLLSANNANSETVILPGDDICLPSGASMPSSTPTTTKPSTTTTAPSSSGSTTTTAPDSTEAPKETTTTSTTTAPKETTTTSAPSGSSGGSPGKNATAAEVKQVIRDVFPDELEEKALDIAYRESRYVPTADNGFCCHGVFQIYYSVHKSWLSDLGINSVQDLYDPVLNAKAALELYRRAGNSWSPWTTA